jgi:N,N'-diacetyllegionaminate synthase
MNTYIIAEAGVNHNGSIDIAKGLIDVAASCGADAVKFQTYKAEKLVSKLAKKAEYQIQTTGISESQFDMLKKLELSQNDFSELKRYSESAGIEFPSSPFDEESLEFLVRLGMKKIKIASGEVTNLPFLEKIAQTKKNIILSTGMCSFSEVEQAIDILLKNGAKRDDITVLHCNTEYPTPFEDVNLRAMITMRDKLGLDTGYSDHTRGITIPIAAVSLGAVMIEKHFTLDKTMSGPDHDASLGPEELESMVKAIRTVEKALGDGIKKPSNSERKNIEIARKSIVAKTEIRQGDIFSTENLTVKRPANGISPMKWHEVIGSKATKDYHEDDII